MVEKRRSYFFLIILLSASLAVSLAVLAYYSVSVSNKIHELEEQNKTLLDDNDELTSQIFDLRQKFGEVSNNTTNASWYVKIDKLYVAPFGSEFEDIRNNTIEAGVRYSVTAEISRLRTNADIDGALGYVLAINIKDEEGRAVDIAWQSGILPFGVSTSGGIYWMPTTPGSYTIDALVLQSLRGTPLGEKQTIHVTVT